MDHLGRYKTLFNLTGARQDIVVVEVQLVRIFTFQMRFEDEVYELPVMIIVHVGDVGVIQFAI